jgi:hypothetical protein
MSVAGAKECPLEVGELLPAPGQAEKKNPAVLDCRDGE